MNYKDQGLPDYQFEGKPLTQSIVKQILMQQQTIVADRGISPETKSDQLGKGFSEAVRCEMPVQASHHKSVFQDSVSLTPR